MDSTSTQQSSPSPRRLAELLNEKQEPFVLEIYLLERGYRITRSLELDRSIIGCCSSTNKDNNSNKSLKKSSSYHVGENPTLNYKQVQFSSIFRTFITKFVTRRWMRKTQSEKQGVESSVPRFSSVSHSTGLSSNTWSDSETDGEFISMPPLVTNENSCIESAPNRVVKTQWRFFEESKQCSPDSVLEEIDLLQSIPVFNNVRQANQNPPTESRIRCHKKVSEDAILSASLWEFLVQLRTSKPKRKRDRKPFPDYMNSKRALQQNRQLLFDCVREAVENGKQQKSTSSSKGLNIGPEEIGKVICKNLKSWGKLSVDETNIQKVLRMDLLGGAINDEWGGFDAWKREVVGEIGNGIVDEIIEDIIIEISMIDYH